MFYMLCFLGRRMGLLQFLKSQFLCHLIICYVFLVSGLLINLIQLCTLPLWLISKQLARRINIRLGYCIASRKYQSPPCNKDDTVMGFLLVLCFLRNWKKALMVQQLRLKNHICHCKIVILRSIVSDEAFFLCINIVITIYIYLIQYRLCAFYRKKIKFMAFF